MPWDGVSANSGACLLQSTRGFGCLVGGCPLPSLCVLSPIGLYAPPFSCSKTPATFYWGNNQIALVGGRGRILSCHCPLSQWVSAHGHREAQPEATSVCLEEEDKAVAIPSLVALPWIGHLVGGSARFLNTLNPGIKYISDCKTYQSQEIDLFVVVWDRGRKDLIPAVLTMLSSFYIWMMCI